MVQETNLSLAVDFSLLKADLGAMLLKEKEGLRILVMPATVEEAPAVRLGELIEDIKKMAGDADSQQLQKALSDAVENANEENKGKSGSAVDLNKITFTLKMLYLYIDTTKESTITEYAVNILINTSGLIPEALKSFVDVRNVGIAVWNTDRNQILSRMSIVDINKALGIESKDTTTDKNAGSGSNKKEPKAAENSGNPS